MTIHILVEGEFENLAFRAPKKCPDIKSWDILNIETQKGSRANGQALQWPCSPHGTYVCANPLRLIFSDDCFVFRIVVERRL